MLRCYTRTDPDASSSPPHVARLVKIAGLAGVLRPRDRIDEWGRAREVTTPPADLKSGRPLSGRASGRDLSDRRNGADGCGRWRSRSSPLRIRPAAASQREHRPSSYVKRRRSTRPIFSSATYADGFRLRSASARARRSTHMRESDRTLPIAFPDPLVRRRAASLVVNAVSRLSIGTDVLDRFEPVARAASNPVSAC